MIRLFSILLLLMATLSVYGATYIPVPVQEQLKKSYGVVEGTFQGNTYKRLPNGDVVTLASFKVNKLSGIKNSEIKNNNDFKIILPGGNWEGLIYEVSGVPKFKSGESVVLLLQKGQFGFHLHNLGLGKYSVVNENGSLKVLKSEVFPQHEKLGRVKYSDFEGMLEARFGHKLKAFTTDKYVYIPPKKKVEVASTNLSTEGRSPASGPESESEGFNPIWLALILALLGAYSIYLVRGK